MHPHGSGFLTRGWHARASLDFCTFCFHNLHRTTKNQDHFQPKTEDKNRAKKMSDTSTKTWEILTKTWEFFGKTWEIFSKMSDVFLGTLGNPPNSTQTLRPLSHKNRGKESHLPKTSLLPSTFFYRKHRKSVSHSAPKSPISALDFPFSTSIPLTSAKKHA